MVRWHKVLEPEGPWPDQGIPFTTLVKGIELYLLRLPDGNWRAWKPVCPHQQASLKGMRPDSDGCITCPLHRYSFSLDTGYEKQGRGRLYLYPVEQRASGVFIGME